MEFRTERGFASSDEGNLVSNAHQAINAFVDTEMAIRMANQDANGNVIASEMAGNEDYSNAGSSSGWQYSNGGWF
ncbi:MAG: hypothetical protein IJ634_05995 [Bacteroidales bacterium]|nr:hypothetical protein [Bacteroidales bacterium]